MTNINNIVIILESVLDDYYFLWECYSEYTQIKLDERNPLDSFSLSLKEAFELEYFYFYEGINFDGDQTVITNFILDDNVIDKLLNWENQLEKEIRITTSVKGVAFLNSFSSLQ